MQQFVNYAFLILLQLYYSYEQLIDCQTGQNSCVYNFKGYYQTGNFCAKCRKNCEICESRNACQQCIAGFYLIKEKKTCDSCLPNCKFCEEKDVCQICNNYYTLTNTNTCVYSNNIGIQTTLLIILPIIFIFLLTWIIFLYCKIIQRTNSQSKKDSNSDNSFVDSTSQESEETELEETKEIILNPGQKIPLSILTDLYQDQDYQ